MVVGTRKILLLGGGGHCLSVLDSLLSLDIYAEIGIIDKNKSEHSDGEGVDRYIMNIPYLGEDEDLQRLYSEGYTDAFITLGSIGDISLRKRLYHFAKSIGFNIPNIIDKSGVVSPSAVFGEGIFVGKNAVVNAKVKIGDCVIINSSSVIEHECELQDFVHIAPGSILSGNVRVDEGTYIGAGTTIKQGIHIGAGSMVGMGSVVLKDIKDRVTAYGNPCKEISSYGN